ncbi:MAG: serine/threonine-protein phosphatase [Bacteroidetes bacterium]|jgi:serine phosphatase RsbU (regulator of sigma subunit)|nr:serine/threonine-protein phosphatase [Bacteroidota bacterium]
MNSLRQLWDLLTGSVSTSEFERFLRQEVPGAYAFYRRTMRDVPEPQSSVRRAMRFVWYLFLAFLEKLTPIRRLLFAVSVILFSLWLFFDGRSDQALWAFLLLNFLLVLEVADKLVTKNELSIAREIQIALQPSEPAEPAGFEVAAYSEVANSVGGDYYDAIQCPDGSVLYVLADVSGKGISAALYTTTVQTALRIYANDVQDPRDLVLRLGEYLRGQLRRSYFLTLLIVRVSPEGRAVVCRAGHPGAIYVDVSERATRAIRPQGAAIGMAAGGTAEVGEALREAMRCEEVQMEEGDYLVMVSDGLLEAVDLEGREYGEARLSALVQTFSADNVAAMRGRILGDVKDFRSGADLRDDVTFILLRRCAGA